MKRYSVWLFLYCITLLTGCREGNRKTNAGERRCKPNVIYIIADDLGIADLSCYGATEIKTPNIDRLAGQGAQFTNAHSTSAASGPSRFAVLTGIYPWRNEYFTTHSDNYPFPVDTAYLTLPRIFKKAGYTTAIIGKTRFEIDARHIGFDYEYTLQEKYLVDKFDKFISSNKNTPFFLYICPRTIHFSTPTHSRFADKSELGARSNAILYLDWAIGEILKTLEENELTENTFIIFTGDTGIHPSGTRIPLIVRWLERIKPSKQQQLFSQIDIYASLAALIKQPLPEQIQPDSQEYLNLLMGCSEQGREYITLQNINNTLAIIKGNRKYIEPGKALTPQLYDLSEDPGETKNIAVQNPCIVAELSCLLQKEKSKKIKK